MVSELRGVASTGSLASHEVHFVMFGAPSALLAVFIGVEEWRARHLGDRAARPESVGRDETGSRVSLWQWVAAGATAGAGLTHGSVIREHFGESLLYGVFFCVLLVTQLTLAFMLLRRPTRRLLERVGFLSISVVCLWLISRTSGLPLGPTPWRPESVGRLDVLASAAELVAVGACAALLLGGRRSRGHPASPRADVKPVPAGAIRGLLHAPVALLCRIGRWLPGGHPLSDSVWARRHRGIVRFALLQALGVGALGFLRGFAVVLCVADVALIAFPALLALAATCGRRVRTVAATVSLMMASVTTVDFAGGVTEAHFHFFVMVGVVALYQDWTAFGVCILITVIDHAVMGILLPDDVYGTPAEQRNPILWAFIHGAFVLGLAFTQVLAWHYIEEQSLSDTLTGLPNRRAFTERLAGMAQTDRRPLSVLILDFDHFKNINDSYGHTVGDNTLRAAAARISACARQGDLLARLGGDEFVILVQGPDAFGPALASRIHDALQTPVVVDGVTVFVRASIGIASVEQTGSWGIEDLMRCADLAMYMAKSNGRNTAVVYDAHLDQAVRERAELAAALQPALEDGQMSLAYQPVVTGADGTMIGVEALARWQHPTLGAIGPATFMPLAEETGDIIAIGLWALQTAAAQAVQWNVSRPGGTELTLAVNVSPVQIGQADFVASVLAALELSGLPPASLILEVTEGLRLHDWTESCARLNELRRLGVRVAIDDFGTGYSSLSYLADLPADIVKIDQSFVRDLLVRASAVVLVRAVMDLATSLGLDVIAEGVESQAQQTVLTDLGCLHSQGYFHSPPLSAEDLTRVLDPSFRAVPGPAAPTPTF